MRKLVQPENFSHNYGFANMIQHTFKVHYLLIFLPKLVLNLFSILVVHFILSKYVR